MKKLFLLAGLAALAAAPAMAEDVTPANYHFNQATALPIFSEPVHGANIQAVVINEQNINIAAPVFDNLVANAGAGEEYNGGLIVLGGGQLHAANRAGYEVMKSAMNLVNLGGEVGQVLAIVGANCDVKDVLKAKTGFDYDIKKGNGGDHPWANINFFTDPNNTPTFDAATGEGQILRAKITYNVYNPEREDGKLNDAFNIGNNIQFKSQQNAFRSGDDAGGEITTNTSFKYDDEEEANTYDPTMWNTMVMEYMVAPEDEEKGAHAPARLVINIPGNCAAISGNCALFIKDITFEGDETNKDYTTVAGEKVPTLQTFAIGDPSVSAVKGLEADENAPVEFFNLQGIRVANPENGIFIRRQGNKTVKVAL